MTAILEALGIHSREGVEAFIEQLIAVLDDVDGDPDLEPWLGWVDAPASAEWNGVTDDREGDHDDLEFDEATGSA